MNNSWQESANKFKTITIPILQKYGKQIGEQTDDEDALNIVRYYSMLYKSYDPLTDIYLQKALENWMKKYVNN